MAFLLDTNVISELRKGRQANERVQTWYKNNGPEWCWISVLSIGEIRKGIEILRRKSPEQTIPYESWLAYLQEDFAEKTLQITQAIAERWGRFQSVRTHPVVDSLIAATAMEHQLTVVTRNTADFVATGCRCVNSWL